MVGEVIDVPINVVAGAIIAPIIVFKNIDPDDLLFGFYSEYIHRN